MREAELHGATVRALMAWDLLDQHHPEPTAFNPRYGSTDAAAALRNVVEEGVGAPAGAVEQVEVCDLPARALLDAAADADLLVLGARGSGGFAGLLAGSVARQCAQHAVVPTAIVHGDERGAGSLGIVAAVDGSDGSRAALRWAAAEAAVRDAPLVALHAWSFAPTETVAFSEAAMEHAAKASEALLDAVVDAAGIDGVAVERRSVAGHPGRVLVDASADAGLIVVGRRGRGGFLDLLLGSVATQVADHAACTVVVVPGE